jgi:uncharacterized membrane protein
MGSLSQAKTLGGIGSILTLLLFAPYYTGAVLVIIGWILILMALKNVSEAVNERSIYSKGMTAAVLSIIGAIVFAAVVAAAILAFIGLGSFSSMNPPTVNSGFVSVLAGLIVGLAIVWILGIVGSYFLWQSFKTISTKLNVGLFGTAGILYFIGSFLTIIFVGFILIFIAQILMIVAFFSIPDNPPGAPMGTPMMPAQPPATGTL